MLEESISGKGVDCGCRTPHNVFCLFDMKVMFAVIDIDIDDKLTLMDLWRQIIITRLCLQPPQLEEGNLSCRGSRLGVKLEEPSRSIN